MQLSAGFALVFSSLAVLAQAPAPPPITNVLVNLTVREGITRDQVMKVMQSEIRDTVRLYLDGKIQQWYSKGDGRGVMFIMNCKTIEEARALMESLPLHREKLVSLEYTPLGPLMPIRMLLGSAPSPGAAAKE